MKLHRITTAQLIFILLTGFVFSGCISTVSASTWQLEKESAGISIYTRAVQGSDIREFKGELVIDTSLASLLAVFQDIEKFPQWNHQCSQAALLKKPNVNELYHYQNLNLPFPVKNRDLVIYSKVQHAKDKIIIHSRIVKNFCTTQSLALCEKIKKSNNIKVNYAKGTHQFIPQKSGGVKVIWQQHIDPAGKIPAFLVNKLLIDVPYITLNKLRKFVKQPKYQKVTLDDLSQNKK